jgi:cytochrome c-type biogenesis protein CcmH/NrfG
MERPQGARPWNNAQVYGMATICLLLGVVAGYLLHAPVVANSAASTGQYSPSAAPAASAANAAQPMPSASDLKRMADKKVEPLLEQLKKNPKDAALLEQIGHSYLAAQQFQSAQQYLEQSVAAKPTPDALNDLSFVSAKMGDIDKTVALLKQARALDPSYAPVLFNLGFFEWRGKSDPKAAIEAWQALLKVDPKNPKRAEVEQMIAQAKKHLSIAPGTKTDKPTM